MVTESLVRISWGGTSKAPVRRSTHLKYFHWLLRVPFTICSPVVVNARDNKEQAGAFGSTRSKAPKAEDDGSFVLLDNLNAAPDGDRESYEDKDI